MGVARLRGVWERLRDSLWFVPSIIVLFAVSLGMLMIELSSTMDREVLSRWPRIFGVGPEGARSMLAAIAGSMITVAGVTFSITMVAVTQASTQYSPRILRNFMGDRANQAVLGTFVGVFAYCLVVLRTIREGDGTEFVPSLAVLLGELLALLGVGVLIFFVHHVAATLQASEIIARIGRDTRRVLDRLSVELTPGDPPEPSEAHQGREEMPILQNLVASPATGYLQQVDLDGLVAVADRFDLLVRLERPTGEFVVCGCPLASFASHPQRDPGSSRAQWSPHEVARALASRTVVGSYRTLDHDPSFGVRQLVDVALKALSPGVNDSTTALICIDHLGALLIRLANRRRRLEHRGRGTWHGRVRVVTCEPGFVELLELATDEIRQHARGQVGVLVRQLGMLEGVAAAAPEGARRRAVLRQVDLVQRSAAATVTERLDLERVVAAAQRARTRAGASTPSQ